MSGLIWVQTVYKVYKHMTPAVKEMNVQCMNYKVMTNFLKVDFLQQNYKRYDKTIWKIGNFIVINLYLLFPSKPLKIMNL